MRKDHEIKKENIGKKDSEGERLNKLERKKTILKSIELCFYLFIIVYMTIGLIPTGIKAETIKDYIYVGDRLDYSDFNLSYQNKLGVNIPISKTKAEKLKIHPSIIDKDTAAIELKLEKYSLTKLTSPIDIREIRTNIDNIVMYEGDTLNTETLIIEIVYEDNSVRNITNELKSQGLLDQEYTFSQHKEITLDTDYGEIIIGKNIAFIESILGNIKGKGEERGLWYAGEVPEIDSLVVEYSNGHRRTIDIKDIEVDWIGRELQEGDNIYSVNYGGKQLAFCIKAIQPK